ncbi:hypothetical protein B0H10DRAFT_1659657, partial [Mycena sp. CBHHK59/15]
EFPESQWLRLLANKAVDLDAVFTGIYSVSPSTAHTESVGEIDFMFIGAAKAICVIVTQSDWTVAWMQTVQAGLTIFPHLTEQYRYWGHFILAKFAAVHESQHQHVINFEKAGRLLASRWADVGLDQYAQFSALETMHLNSMGHLAVESVLEGSGRSKNQPPHGSGSGRGSSNNGASKSKGRNGGKSTEPCRLWNNGRCKREAADCRNLHICTGC